ncbi:MAG: hypothetical protein KAJ55_12865 [Anaerolineales bacterium]|nr:hypothetical protein [Anaerolineales bacterium]
MIFGRPVNDLSRIESVVLSNLHISHASSCFFPSPFDEAAILTIDGILMSWIESKGVKAIKKV